MGGWEDRYWPLAGPNGVEATVKLGKWPRCPNDPSSSSVPLADLPAWQARARPGATALRFDGVAAGYAALHRRSLQWAAWLRAQGVRRGDRIAWLGLNHPDQIALLFAVARVGALLVPLNFRLAPAEWDAVLADCTPRCVIHDAAGPAPRATWRIGMACRAWRGRT
jgi:acyl-CoA synthetase (AMP-forming)/AMP-acid ligase II